MIKILVVGIANIYGGIESYIKNVVDNISKEKFQFDFVNLNENEKIAFQDEFLKNNSKIYNIPNRKKNFFSYRRKFIEILSNNNYDIIHIHIMSYEAFERIIWAIRYSEAKVIVHSHNAGFGSNAKLHTRLLHYLGKMLLNNKKFYKAACGKDAGKWLYNNNEYIILNNGIEYDKYKFDIKNRINMRNNLGIQENEIVIGHTGRLELQKNHNFLIDVFYEYYKKNSSSKLILVGDGSLRKSLEEKIERLNISNNVIFIGFVENVNEYYSAFDIFVLPSLFEGLSISLVEAQTNGLKCFCSTNIDVTSDITGNIYFLNLELSSKEWADKIFKENIKRDDCILEHINKEYFIQNSIKKLEKYYIDILDKR